MKAIKICPVCDQPMKGHWCGSCHQFIREPVRREVRSSAYSTNVDQESLDQEPSPAMVTPVSLDEKKTGFSAGKIVGIAITVIVVINALTSLLLSFEEFPQASPEPEPVYPYEDKLLSDAEILGQYDTHCNGRGHLSLTKEAVTEEVTTYLTDLGYQVEEHKEETFNQVLPSQDGDDTYFNNYFVMFGNRVQEDGFLDFDSYYSVFLETDTVTGELHNLSVYFPDLAEGVALWQNLFRLAAESDPEAREDWNGVSQELKDLAASPDGYVSWSHYGDNWELYFSYDGSNEEYYSYLSAVS